MFKIVEARTRPGYRLWVRFEDGIEGEVDLSDLVGKGVFKRWQNETEFHKVYIDPESCTVAWPGGIDLAPDALHHDIAGVATS